MTICLSMYFTSHLRVWNSTANQSNNSGMGGSGSLGAEVFFRQDQAPAEQPGPQSIDGHPCGQRVAGIHQPLGQSPAVAGIVIGEGVQGFRCRGRDRLARFWKLPRFMR